MATVRRPFQGVGNILRFNWHFYVLALAGAALLAAAGFAVGGRWGLLAFAALAALAVTTIVSLLVSAYVYDLSGFYEMSWLDRTGVEPGERMANIHAGFDETSAILRRRYPGARWTVLDFYDPAKHTEVSIRRARRAHPPSPEDLPVDTAQMPLPSGSQAAIFLILAAHEIRDAPERHAFFAELHRILEPRGRIVLVEHLRDLNNFLAYSLGAFHFIGRGAWRTAFEQAGLRVAETLRINPFITCFVLEKDALTA